MSLRRHMTLAATLLASLSLAACHQQENTSLSTADLPTEQVTDSQEKKLESKEEAKASDKSSQGSAASETTVAPTTVTEEKPVSSQASRVDIAAIAQGDYSSLAGTWRDPEGRRLVIDAQGGISHVVGETAQDGYTVQVTSTDNGLLLGGLLAPDGSAVASFMVVPAGIATPNAQAVYDVDVICSGQSALAEQEPYVKVD